MTGSEPQPLRTIIYTRQSLARGDETEDTSLSLDMQERECRLLAARNEWTVLEPVIRDHDVRGNDPGRPGIAELFRRLEQERAQVVLVYAMSRFARDYLLQETLWRKLHAAGVRLVSIKEPQAEDDLMRGILGVIAQADRKRMGAFISSAQRERARRGLPHGATPFGFRKGDDGRLVIDPDEAAWVRRMITRIEAGWSIWRVARWLNDEGVAREKRTWKPIAVGKLLRNPVLAGAVHCGDVVTWEAHEGIIDRDEFDRLQHLLANRRTVRTKSAASWLEGLISCGCGSPMHLVLQRPAKGRPAPMFRCTNYARGAKGNNWNAHLPACNAQRRSVRVHLAEAQVIGALERDLDTLIDWQEAYKQASTAFAASTRNHAADRRRCTKAVAALEQERDRLLHLYVRGKLDADRWEVHDAEVVTRLNAAQRELDALPMPPDPDVYRTVYGQMIAAREAIADTALLHPARIRGVLMDAGATVSVQAESVEIVWPPLLVSFLARA